MKYNRKGRIKDIIVRLNFLKITQIMYVRLESVEKLKGKEYQKRIGKHRLRGGNVGVGEVKFV